MLFAGSILCLAFLSTILVQDIRTRSIAWWTLPPILSGSVMMGLSHTSISLIAHNAMLNIIILLLNFALLFLWLFVRKGSSPRFFRGHIGVGDLLFLVSLCAICSPMNFIVLYSGGLLVSLAIALLVRITKSNGQNTIPLAGYFSIPVMSLCIFQLFYPAFDPYNQQWMLSLLNY